MLKSGVGMFIYRKKEMGEEFSGRSVLSMTGLRTGIVVRTGNGCSGVVSVAGKGY